MMSYSSEFKPKRNHTIEDVKLMITLWGLQRKNMKSIAGKRNDHLFYSFTTIKSYL